MIANKPTLQKQNTGVEAALHYGVSSRYTFSSQFTGKKQVFLPMPSLGPIIMINQSKIIISFANPFRDYCTLFSFTDPTSI
jgi:hypothetical protein